MICGELTTLRALEERDVERLRGWRNHPELMGLHFSDLPVSDIEQKNWYQAYATSRTKVFMVESKQDEAAGYVILKDLDHKNRQAEIGIHLDPAHQGKGYGKDAFHWYAFVLKNSTCTASICRCSRLTNARRGCTAS